MTIPVYLGWYLNQWIFLQFLEAKVDLSLIERVMRIYEDFDVVISRAGVQFGMHCPPGCGTCCNSPKVEATVLEMLPLAMALWQSGQGEALLDQYTAVTVPSRCLFFTPDELHFGHGRCSVYPHRPTLCRLFGFAAVRQKQGNRQFAACRFIKAMIPETVAAVQADLEAGGEYLLFTEAAHRIAELCPSLDRRFLINEALLRALEQVGMYLSYSTAEDADSSTPEIDPEYPPPLKQCC